MEVKEIDKQKTKDEVIHLLNMNGILHNTTSCYGCERICISFDNNKNFSCNNAITVQISSNDICRVYPQEILYVAIENRKSVLYLTDRKIETNYTIEHWKSILDKNMFVQPHYSYIVNLNYVNEVTKDFVRIKCNEKEYSVYTSLRKFNQFKKAFLDFKR